MEIVSLLHPDFFRDPDTIIRKLVLYIGDKHLYTGVAQQDAGEVARLFPHYSLAHERVPLSSFEHFPLADSRRSKLRRCRFHRRPILEMKVVILCGGLGTRLREETEFRPKPMVEIGGKPILWHIMKTYTHYGFKDFILCLGYKSEMIKEYFYNYEILNSDFTVELGNHKSIEIHSSHGEKGWRVTLAETGDKALKGVRLKRVEKYVDGKEFMVTYGDGVADIDINDLLRFHRSHGKLATLTGVCPLSRFGELTIEGKQVIQFTEKPQSSGGLINGGFFVFSRKIFEYLEDRDDCDLEYGALEKIASQGQLMVYELDRFWYCMDTIRDVDYLNKLCMQGKAPWMVWCK